MKGPEPFLRAQSIDVRDALDPSRPAVLDSSRRTFLGHDIFFFADDASRAAFEKNPLRWARRLTDPVTLKRFRPTPRSPRFTHGGRRYWFASDSTRMVFRSMPDSFAVRKGM